MEEIKKKSNPHRGVHSCVVGQLKEMHAQALKPNLDSDTARDEQEIEIQTKEITKVPTKETDSSSRYFFHAKE